MTIIEAYDIIDAPFATIEAYEQAVQVILAKTTNNRRALYAKLPPQHKIYFLRALIREKGYESSGS